MTEDWTDDYSSVLMAWLVSGRVFVPIHLMASIYLLCWWIMLKERYTLFFFQIGLLSIFSTIELLAWTISLYFPSTCSFIIYIDLVGFIGSKLAYIAISHSIVYTLKRCHPTKGLSVTRPESMIRLRTVYLVIVLGGSALYITAALVQHTILPHECWWTFDTPQQVRGFNTFFLYPLLTLFIIAGVLGGVSFVRHRRIEAATRRLLSQDSMAGRRDDFQASFNAQEMKNSKEQQLRMVSQMARRVWYSPLIFMFLSTSIFFWDVFDRSNLPERTGEVIDSIFYLTGNEGLINLLLFVLPYKRARRALYRRL
eukprot:gnl/Dysnectes_brevis/2467_a2948_1292.p1 GENE.gnl/Dysnectes_brevis/2467_a2948_1292~~gnl/Dysnectes_brevis/2467_a2948_1292.p1  ORF type:complete len:311 (-),score=71.05 gnl/Dysnectes_brevis/2467_a2948_1292:192-1124(-)